MDARFAKGLLRQELALESIEDKLGALFPEPLVTTRKIFIGQRLVALDIKRAPSGPNILFSNLVDRVYDRSGVGRPEVKGRYKRTTYDREGLGFHIDSKIVVPDNNVRIRFWNGSRGKTAARFALATTENHIDALAYQGSGPEERKTAALMLPLSDTEVLEEGAILAFASHHQVPTGSSRILAVGTPHLFEPADDSDVRHIYTENVAFPDPLAGLEPLAVAKLLVEYGLTT